MRWLISFIALWFVAAPTDATADITRSCSANFVSYANLVVATINGEGTCKNKAKANECRTRAREAIVACARAMFDARAEGTVIPAACQGGRGARRAVLQWQQIIKGTGVRTDNLADRVRWNECCRLQSERTNTQALLSIVGDKGCGSTKIGKNLFQSDIVIGTIHFNCEKQRQNGLCN